QPAFHTNAQRRRGLATPTRAPLGAFPESSQPRSVCAGLAVRGVSKLAVSSRQPACKLLRQSSANRMPLQRKFRRQLSTVLTPERNHMAFYVKCKCRNCDQHIEFNSSDSGQTVVCPGCGMDTILCAPPVAQRQQNAFWSTRRIATVVVALIVFALAACVLNSVFEYS